VVGGLTVATILIIFVPIFYYAIEKLRARKEPEPDGKSTPAVGPVAADSDGKT
jgi:hypothetical protein